MKCISAAAIAAPVAKCRRSFNGLVARYLAFVFVFFALQSALAQGQTAASFPLHVSANGRYLVDANQSPFLIHGDTAWQLMVMVDRGDAEYYLENRRQKGFNAIIANLTDNFYGTDAPNNVYGDGPFTTPGDFSSPNESYFAHVDWVLARAAEKGIVVFLNPAYLGSDNDGWWGEIITNGPARSRKLGRYLGNRYKNFTNIVWTAGGDRNPAPGSQGERNTLEILKGIKETAPAQLWTAHWSADQDSLDEPAFRPYMDLNGIYTYETGSGFVHQRMLAAYNRSGPKPTYLYESKYETPSTPPEMWRRQAYEADLSGSTGQFFGSDHSGFNDLDWHSELESQGNKDMIRVKQLFAGRAWYTLVPDQNHSLVSAGFGTFGTSQYVTVARASDGSLGMAYIPSTGTGPRSLTVDMSQLSGSVAAQWYNPTTGSYTRVPESPFVNRGQHAFSSPGDNGTGKNDWVLVLETSGLTDSGAGDAIPAGVPLIHPTGLLAVCGRDLSHVTVSWNAVAGADNYFLRVDNEENNADGQWLVDSTDFYIDGRTAISFTGSVVANASYNWWVHGASSSQGIGPASSGTFTCSEASQAETSQPRR